MRQKQGVQARARCVAGSVGAASEGRWLLGDGAGGKELVLARVLGGLELGDDGVHAALEGDEGVAVGAGAVLGAVDAYARALAGLGVLAGEPPEAAEDGPHAARVGVRAPAEV